MNTIRKTLLAASLAAAGVVASPATAATWTYDLTGNGDSLGLRVVVEQTVLNSFSLSFSSPSGLNQDASGSWFGAAVMDGIGLNLGTKESTALISAISGPGGTWSLTGTDSPGALANNCGNGVWNCYGGGAASIGDLAGSGWTFTVTTSGNVNLATTGLHLQMSAKNDFLSGNGKNKSYYNGNSLISNQVISPVPEPETYAMMLAGLGVIGAVVRRRRQQQA